MSQERLQKIDEEIETCREVINELKQQRYSISTDISKHEGALKGLQKEKEQLIANSFNDESIKTFLTNHPKYEYIGKTDGKDMHPYVKCKKCDVHFNLFECGTGIGSVVVGVCPKCQYEVDFTDFGSW